MSVTVDLLCQELINILHLAFGTKYITEAVISFTLNMVVMMNEYWKYYKLPNGALIGQITEQANIIVQMVLLRYCGRVDCYALALQHLNLRNTELNFATLHTTTKQ